MRNMTDKATIITITILMIILITCGIGIFIYLNRGVMTYKEIDYKELVEINDSGDELILFIGSSTCSHCTVFKEVLNEVIPKYHVLVYYIDISKLEDEQIAYIKANYAFSATPTTVFVKEGKEPVSERVLEKVKGVIREKELVELFKKYEYIK